MVFDFFSPYWKKSVFERVILALNFCGGCLESCEMEEKREYFVESTNTDFNWQQIVELGRIRASSMRMPYSSSESYMSKQFQPMHFLLKPFQLFIHTSTPKQFQFIWQFRHFFKRSFDFKVLEPEDINNAESKQYGYHLSYSRASNFSRRIRLFST